jgi:hypothetical protein
MKAGTPNLYFVFALPMNLIGTSALDELYRLLKGCFAAGSDEQMEMIRHHNEFVEQVCAAIPILQHAMDEDLRIFLYLKDGAVLPGLRGNEVAASWRCAVRQSPHCIPQGLKPFSLRLYVGAEAPTP